MVNSSIVSAFVDAVIGKISGLISSHNTSNSAHASLFDDKSEVGHTHTTSNITDFPTIPTKTSDLTNDGDGTNVFVKNNDSRLSDSRTPTSHTHGNLQSNGQVGSTAQANKNVVTDSKGKITTENKPTIPTAVSNLTNDSDFTTINDVLEYISENATLTIPTTGDDAGYLVLTIQ